LKHSLDASVHLFFLNELAPLGLLNALADGGSKTGVLFE
jgi:hypothetical protein